MIVVYKKIRKQTCHERSILTSTTLSQVIRYGGISIHNYLFASLLFRTVDEGSNFYFGNNITESTFSSDALGTPIHFRDIPGIPLRRTEPPVEVLLAIVYSSNC